MEGAPAPIVVEKAPLQENYNSVDLTFKNLTYEVKVKNPNRRQKGQPRCNLN